MRFVLHNVTTQSPEHAAALLSTNRCTVEYAFAELFRPDDSYFDGATISADDMHDNAECLSTFYDAATFNGESLALATGACLTIVRPHTVLQLFFDIER